MAVITPKKVLLVEGNTEKRLIPELMEQRGVTWEPEAKKYAVEIVPAGGPVTAPGLIHTRLKESGVARFGVVFDADEMNGVEQDRWAAFTQQCSGIGIELPLTAPATGFLSILPSGIRFGAWMMPDNRPPGMLETFLFNLVKTEESAGPVLQHAQDSVTKAKALGACFKSVHRDKALIHTWLAWQDQPGAQLHEAIKFKILDATSPRADAFVQWFRNLFEV